MVNIEQIGRQDSVLESNPMKRVAEQLNREGFEEDARAVKKALEKSMKALETVLESFSTRLGKDSTEAIGEALEALHDAGVRAHSAERERALAKENE